LITTYNSSFYKTNSLFKKSIMKKSISFLNQPMATRPLLLLTVALASSLIISCNNSSDTKTTEDSAANTTTTISPAENTSGTQTAVATISGTKADTTVEGTATFTQEGTGNVKMELSVTVAKMANKTVAVHIHEHPDCGDSGKNTHGHWNPTNQAHGKWGSAAFHAGDIGNVTLDANGKGSTTIDTNLWSIGGDSTKNILNRAIIVHSGTDDFTTQPTGNAGSRIGCGIIEKK
jgi:Cu-Zn family superoxide dismutase